MAAVQRVWVVWLESTSGAAQLSVHDCEATATDRVHELVSAHRAVDSPSYLSWRRLLVSDVAAQLRRASATRPAVTATALLDHDVDDQSGERWSVCVAVRHVDD